MLGLFLSLVNLVVVVNYYTYTTSISSNNQKSLVQTPVYLNKENFTPSPTPLPSPQETYLPIATLKPTLKPTSKTSPTPKPIINNLSSLDRDQIYKLINNYRSSKGINTLTTSSEICTLVETRADFLFANNLANAKASLSGSHVGFIEQMKVYSGKGYAENIAIGAETSERVLILWQESPGHNSNLLATQIGSVLMSKSCVATRGSGNSTLAIYLIGDK